MVVFPVATPVTRPLVDTDAIAALDVDHVTILPVSTFEDASRVVAVSACVPPTVNVADGGLTFTVATGNGPGVVPPLESVDDPHALLADASRMATA
jgi:hypothetical protein